MSIQLTKPLIVPEWKNAVVQTYTADPVTTNTIPRPGYRIDFQSIVSALFPGDPRRIARPNACALNGNDLFIAQSAENSQAIFKLPNYLEEPEQAIKRAFTFTLDGSDYVGMAFDAAGNLYAAEGSSKDNSIVKYTGTAKPDPDRERAAENNYIHRDDLGNPGAKSYFANLAFDADGTLWVSDSLNHRLVVFEAAQLGHDNTFHVLTNLTESIPVANTDVALNENTSHLFAEPEGLDFDADGNLWVANNNDNGAGNVQTTKTTLVKLTPALQKAVLTTGPGESLTPTVPQSNVDFFIYQVPNLDNNQAGRPQFGGLQIDRTAARLFVNEQIAGKGRGYDIATIAAIGTATAANDLDIVSTNPGNGGIALVNATGLVVDSDLQSTATTPAGLRTVDSAVTSLAGTGTLAGGFKKASSILKGINLSGFSDRSFYHQAPHAQMDFYKAKGINFFRIPIWWDRLQPTLSAPFDAKYDKGLFHQT